ncbi:MAG: hypothetical protein DI565_06690 [Ancylobacter novellus]|uniref:Uncharacterized protein n=1 Tax=Ancylobacter novellus TaxID=921 RepID=A0A2W5KIY6_ANCNO|nr:MAG: hypothetical protein DI565_06690 [Ancylobacter novellus]
MSTGISSVSNLAELGAMYPFAGFEWLFAVIVLAFTLFFIAKQISMDKEEAIEAAAAPIPSATPTSMAAAE